MSEITAVAVRETEFLLADALDGVCLVETELRGKEFLIKLRHHCGVSAETEVPSSAVGEIGVQLKARSGWWWDDLRDLAAPLRECAQCSWRRKLENRNDVELIYG